MAKFETEAEKAYQRYQISQGFLTDRARATFRPFTKKNGEAGMASSAQDFFSVADIMAVKKDEWLTFSQVTTGEYEAQRQRKRKLEAIPWPEEVHVELVVVSKEPDPVDMRRKRWRFERELLVRDHEYPAWVKLPPVFIGLS